MSKIGVVDAFPNPLREIAVELLGQEEIGETAVLRVEQVHILHGLVDHIVVFRLQLRAAVGEQELDEGVQELDVALGRLQGERVDARAVFADAVNFAAVQLDHALIAAADVEDVGEAAVLSAPAQ